MTQEVQMSLNRPTAPNPYELLPAVGTLSVASEDVRDGEQLAPEHLFNDWGMTGLNLSPQLSWSGAPEGTRSYAVTCFDPDAPTPSGFWHWCVADIPASVTSLERGATLPEPAFAVANDTGSVGYAGAAPPAGDVPHRYYFVVHAVDVESLGVPLGASCAVVSFNLVFHTLARGMVVPVYSH
jgi:Raf kinase inhibitor-like YbhB/YbcL family protein